MRYAQKTNASLLAFLYYQWCYISWSMQIIDGKLSNEGYFGQQVKVLKNYEIVTPAIYNAGDLNDETGSSTVIQIGAFGETYDIVLQNKNNQSTYSTYVEYIGKNNSYEAKYLRENECFYSGIVNTSYSEPFEVVLNYCNGIEGMIHTNNSLIFIEPMRNNNKQKKTIHQKHIVYKGEDVRLKINKDVLREKFLNVRSNFTRRRHRREVSYQTHLTFINKSGRRVILYYRNVFHALIPFATFLEQEETRVNTYVGTTWIAKDEKTDQVLLLNEKTEFIATKNRAFGRIAVSMTKPRHFKGIRNIVGNGQLTNRIGGDQYYIEVLVVADESVINFHGKDRIEKYILTMMDIASRVFEHESLGILINFEVVRIHLVEDNQGGFTVYKNNPSRTLRSACSYISSLQNPDEFHPHHFDFGIALSREDFGPSGYAQLHKMCSFGRSCVLVQDEGLTSAFIVAHETGHLLGLEHDGDGEASRCTNEGPVGSIMSAIIQARYDKYRWSTCSQEVLKENIEFFHCLKNRPRQRFKPSLGNHGAHYTLTEQCQFNFNKEYDICTLFTFNPCRELFCGISNSYKCKRRGPALQGTICDHNKYCLNGECVEHEDRLFPPYEEEIIDGNWGEWSSWSTCSRSCGVGIRSRRRECDTPKKSRRGKPCNGKSVEKEVCNTKICEVKSLPSRQIEYCQEVNGNDWTVYSDKDFALRLRQQRSNPNCTFESGFCNWKNYDNNDIDWEICHGGTQSFNTGPSTDHTFGNIMGAYIYAEASSTRYNSKQEGDIARLISKSINVPRVCFTVHYHMFGHDMGKLRVKIKYQNDSEHTLWKEAGDKGDMWRKAEIHIESVERYKLIIEAVRGSHWASDIAVDDLSAVAGSCPSTETIQDQCKVSCRTKNARNFKMNINVTDGERCGSARSSNICLDGKCVTFGCDNKFGSKLQVDECGVCGGNGSKCIEVSDNKEIRLLGGYQSFLTLEKGSTFIDIQQEYSKHKYAFGLRRIGKKSARMIRKTEAYLVLAGSVFHFKRFNGKQHIFSRGPLSESVDVMIFSYKRYREHVFLTVRYEYFKPSSAIFSYSYETTGWETCSRSCGTGQQKSVVSCTRVHDKVTVNETFCNELQMPLYIRACHLDPCPQKYKWQVTNWQSCSKTCGGGLRVRIVLCIHALSSAIVRDTLCSTVHPDNTEACNINPCPKWHTSNWGTCSQKCGTGTQSRKVKCIDQSTGNPVDDDQCVSNNKPDNLTSCNNQPCEKFVYIIQEVGNCTKSCGGGLKPQIVFCVKNSTREAVDSKYCDGPSPPRILVCNPQSCPEFEWKITSSTCSQTCGEGTVIRKMLCFNIESNKTVEDFNCPFEKPRLTNNCNQGKCPEFKWQIWDSSPCSQTCGNGSIIRDVVCVNMNNKEEVDANNCLENRPSQFASCFITKCLKYEVKYSYWGECSSTCGSGIEKRTFTCLDTTTGLVVSANLCAKEKIQLIRSCTNKCPETDQLLCDFDRKTFCNWQNTKTDDFDWSVGNKTPSHFTGPRMIKQGYFAFVEASAPRKKGETAVLYSPFINIPKGCFSFRYHMRGKGNMGRLRVLLSSVKTSELLFEKSGHQGTYWIQAKIDIKKGGPYRIIFEAIRGKGVYGDAAIDDISFENKDCEKNYKKHVRATKIADNCREISPHCRHENREHYCRVSPPYRTLCCRTCPLLLNT